MFLLAHVGTLCESQICAVGVNENELLPAVYCLDQAGGPKDASIPLFLLAHRGRSKWLKPSVESTPARLGDWHLQLGKVRRARCFYWKTFLHADITPMGVPSELYNFRHFQVI